MLGTPANPLEGEHSTLLASASEWVRSIPKGDVCCFDCEIWPFFYWIHLWLLGKKTFHPTWDHSCSCPSTKWMLSERLRGPPIALGASPNPDCSAAGLTLFENNESSTGIDVFPKRRLAIEVSESTNQW